MSDLGAVRVILDSNVAETTETATRLSNTTRVPGFRANTYRNWPFYQASLFYGFRPAVGGLYGSTINFGTDTTKGSINDAEEAANNVREGIVLTQTLEQDPALIDTTG